MSDSEGRTTSRTGLADPGLDDQLRTSGYAVLPARLPPAAVQGLTDLYEGVVAEDGRDTSGSFRPSMLIRRADLRARLWDGVRALTAAHLEPHFQPGTTEVFGGSFVSKPPGPDGGRNPHQDPTVSDESDRASLSVWIPLTDSTLDNGTLWALPGSHRMGNRVRPPDVASFTPEVGEVALAHSVPLELEAGSLLVIDGEVVHHSLANESSDERIAAIVAIRPPGRSMRIVRSDGGAPEGVARIYDVHDEQYRSGDLVRPELPAEPTARLRYRPATLDDLARARRAAGLPALPAPDQATA